MLFIKLFLLLLLIIFKLIVSGWWSFHRAPSEPYSLDVFVPFRTTRSQLEFSKSTTRWAWEPLSSSEPGEARFYRHWWRWDCIGERRLSNCDALLFLCHNGDIVPRLRGGACIFHSFCCFTSVSSIISGSREGCWTIFEGIVFLLKFISKFLHYISWENFARKYVSWKEQPGDCTNQALQTCKNLRDSALN